MTILDATGLEQPMPVLRARRKLKELNDGDSLEIHASDPAAIRDFPAFCAHNGHELIMAREENGIFIFEIRKAGIETSEAA